MANILERHAQAERNKKDRESEERLRKLENQEEITRLKQRIAELENEVADLKKNIGGYSLGVQMLLFHYGGNGTKAKNNTKKAIFLAGMLNRKGTENIRKMLSSPNDFAKYEEFETAYSILVKSDMVEDAGKIRDTMNKM